MTKSKLLEFSFCLVFIFIKALTCFDNNYIDVTNVNKNNPKLVISYPEYTGLDPESYEINSETLLKDYITACESKLKNLFGLESDNVSVIVNGFELNKDELSYPVESFIVSRNEDIRVNIEIKTIGSFVEGKEKDKIELQNRLIESKQGHLDESHNLVDSDIEKEGILILRFVSYNNEELLSSKVPASLTVKRKFPVTNRDLLVLISEIASPSEFLVESISTSKNENVNLLDYINEANQDNNSEVKSGDLLFIKLSEIGEYKEKMPLESGIIPVRIVFSNRNIANQMFRFEDNTKMSEVMRNIFSIKDPETGKNLSSNYNNILVQNEEGMTIDTNSEDELKNQIPSGQTISESRPLVFFLTVLTSKLTEDNYANNEYQDQDQDQDQDKLSEVFDTNNVIEDEAFKTSARFLGENNEKVGFPEILFVHDESGFEVKLKNDPTFTTFASLYSQAQLIWSTINFESKEKNCLLISKRSSIEEELLDPNKHETLITSHNYYNGMKLIMINPKRINVTVRIYINKGNDELEFSKRLGVNVPEIISVKDFLMELNKKHGSVLSRYLIIGLQRKIDDDNLVEYLSDPKVPSTITYLSFTETDLSGHYVLLEVERVKKIDILLLLPFEVSGEEITESVDEDSHAEANKGAVVEYKLTILSNTSVKDLVNNIIRKKILKKIPFENVYIKDNNTKDYLKSDYIIGYHVFSTTQNENGDDGVNKSKIRKGEKNNKSTMVFEISVLKYMELNISFYYPQGDGYSNENLHIRTKRNKTIKKLKEMILSKGVKKRLLDENLKIGVGSGYDLGNYEFNRVVYSVLNDNTKLVDSGISPTDDNVRVYVIEDKTENKVTVDDGLGFGGLMINKMGEGEKKRVSILDRIKQYKGTVLEVPLSLENCPLNTLLEKRWFVVPMTLDIPIGELKMIIDEVATLKGVEFSLFAETGRGRLELDQILESCSSLGITEIGLLNAVCHPETDLNTDEGGLEKTLIQAIVEDRCIFGDSKAKCELAKDVEEDIRENFGPEKTEMDENEGMNKSFGLLVKIDKKLKKLEDRELKMNKNKKIIEKMKKKDDSNYKHNLLSRDDLNELLKKFIKTYLEKGVR
ncbi:hypothetical protein FG379_003722, partial [Cryptosporidium bovis]|uniref:uncharacterized protein n=1 Tax=Cryptosporidium bovis TaxID=310047 RepID=UPI003519E559